MAKGAPAKTKQNVKDETPKSWQNRIVGTGTEAPDQLLANPRNWRVHPQHQQEGLAAVLDKVGWVQRVVVNKRTGHLVDGHLRVTLAMRRNEPTVPVVYVDLSPDEEALILATLDPIAGLAATDQDGLRLLLEEVSAEGQDADLQKLLDTIGQDAGLNIAPPPSLDDLEREHGQPEDDLFWPTLKIKVPKDVAEQFDSAMNRAQGGSEWEKFRWLLDRVGLTT